MKKLILSLAVLFAAFNAEAQAKHIKWTVVAKKTSAKTADIYFQAVLDPHWHIWSQNPGDDMLIPPTFSYDDKTVKNSGKAKEVGKKIAKKEEGFDGTLYSYEGKVVFVQKVTLTKLGEIKGTINYQICDEKSCLPPTNYKFTVTVK